VQDTDGVQRNVYDTYFFRHSIGVIHYGFFVESVDLSDLGYAAC
jgi:hypothetical protein